MATKNRKVNRAWLNDHLNDPYVKMAQRDGYRARAAYKLKEINDALGLLRPGQLVVDLGSAPGAWSQYLRREYPDTTVIALDILPMEPVDGVTFIQGDFREDGILQQLHEAVKGRPVDVVVSDMAPNLSGIASSDAARISHLVELALEFASTHLQPRGALVTKVFHGSGYSQIVEQFKRHFVTVKPLKPKSSRDRSAETFLIGIGLK
ncbi:RlmE family RNA methyltransferase [Amphibiibacter pelophylacis]|uniref:RlmE family RNA methyltransferase n=1 Tax=Amphibiibacter pelophylacis TaxID=1799477 RepID=A0ACC6NZS3_9BURK